MAGILSTGVKLSYATTSGGSYTEVSNVQDFPDMGAAAELVEVTCLADGNKKYIDGLKDFGALEFNLLYDNSEATSNYRVLKGLEGALTYFKVEFPDALTTGTGTHHGTQFAFAGYPTCIISGAGTGAALTFKLSINLNSDVTVSNPE